MTEIRIVKSDATWVVRANGAVIGESDNALELFEGDYPAIVYFPRDAIAMAFLDATDHSTHCPHKGDASYFNIVGKSNTLENAAWSYEAPKDKVAAIKDHIAFYPSDMLKIESL